MSLSLNLGQKSGTDLSNSLLPEQTNLNTWLTQPSTDGKTSVNVKGTDATFTGTNALTFDGSNDFIQANNTGLGAGNFYYEMIFKFDWEDGDYLLVDGDTSTNNRWLGLQYKVGATGLTFSLDGDGTKTTYEIFSSSEVSNTDIVKIVVKREGSTVTSQGFNLTQDSSTTDAHTNSGNFSGGNKLTIGALWSGSGASNFSPMELYSFKAGTSETDLLTHYTCAEGNGNTIFDISGQGNHATNTGATRSTESSSLIVSHNNLNGFDKDIFRGYEGHWDLVAAGSGTFQANANNITLTGNTGVSGKLRQSVFGLESGDTLVVSGTVVQTGATGGSNQDVAISSASAGWSEGSVFLGGEIGTYNFSTTLNANSSTCDIQFVVLNAANITISDLKFIVVKKIPALTSKTLAFYSPDGSNDSIFFNHSLNSSSDWQAESEFIVADTVSTQQAVFSATGTTNNDYGFMLRYEDGAERWRLRIADTTSFYITKPNLIIGDVYKVTLSYFSSTNTCTLVVEKNGVAETFVDNQSISNTPDFNGEAAIARLRWSGSYGGWDYKTVKFTQGTTTNVELDIANSTGLSTVADLSGNGNNGTLQNSTLTVNWAKRYVDSNGIIVGGDYSTGNTSISNPSGYVHNGSECGLDLITTDVSASDIASINNASATQTFAKRDATNSDLVIQLLQYSSALSDAGELARTRAYVS